MRKLIVLSILALALIATSTAQANSLQVPHKPFNQMTAQQKIVWLRKQLHRDKAVLRFWKNHRVLETVVFQKRESWARNSLRIVSGELHRMLLPKHPLARGSDMGAWLCIHHYEGAWNDPNAPYWGGLQMDLGFQQTYGAEFMRRWGTADNWPIWAQITAARRARDGYHGYPGRGYSPWSTTAHLCGLY